MRPLIEPVIICLHDNCLPQCEGGISSWIVCNVGILVAPEILINVHDSWLLHILVRHCSWSVE